MSPYTLELTGDAEDHLAQIWMEAADRQTINDAERTIYAILVRDPVNAGTAVSEGLMRILNSPLVTYYSIDSERKHVVVDKVIRMESNRT